MVRGDATDESCETERLSIRGDRIPREGDRLCVSELSGRIMESGGSGHNGNGGNVQPGVQ